MQHDLKFYSNSNRLENATGLYWANIPAHNNTGWLNSSRPDLSSYLIFKAKVWSEKKNLSPKVMWMLSNISAASFIK